jgi:regulatory protein
MKRPKKASYKPITEARLQELALRYVGRYAATEAMLRRNLLNHVKRAERLQKESTASSSDVSKWISAIVQSAVKKGYVNDQTYAESVTRVAQKSGWSKRKISQKLMQKGIGRDMLAHTMEQGADDMRAALIFARRRSLGPYRKVEEADKELRTKEMEKLCRAGFSPEMARKIVRLSPDQLEEMEDELRTKYA